MLTIRLLMFALFIVFAVTQLTGCEDSTVLSDQAYAEGHQAGRIWCGKQGLARQAIVIPDYSDEMMELWFTGFALGERAAGCIAEPELPKSQKE
jgi:hypothetical protein